MTRLLPALLMAASASAASVTIDDFSTNATTGVTVTDTESNSPLVEGYAATGIWRQMSIERWSVGSATVTTGGGSISSVSDVGATIRLTYFFESTTSLIPSGALAADSQISLGISNTSSDILGISVWIFSNATESSAYWNINVAGQSSGVFSANLIDLSPTFPWDSVDAIQIDYGIASGGTTTFGIDGKGLAVAAPVPEPATYGFMLSALALVGAAVRRRSRSN